MKLSCIEICAGAGGQSLGLEQAGFDPEALIEIDSSCCHTLRTNRPNWNVIEDDLRNFDGTRYKGVDLLTGGVPCPSFSKAGKQMGSSDDRDMFPEALRLVSEIQPKAVMFENVRGFLDSVFEDYRLDIKTRLQKLGYFALCQCGCFTNPCRHYEEKKIITGGLGWGKKSEQEQNCGNIFSKTLVESWILMNCGRSLAISQNGQDGLGN